MWNYIFMFGHCGLICRSFRRKYVMLTLFRVTNFNVCGFTAPSAGRGSNTGRCVRFSYKPHRDWSWFTSMQCMW